MTSRRIELSRDILSNLKASKVFAESSKPLNSISFSDTGEYCVTAGQDDSLNIYNCKEGKQKYGVTLARFTHHKNNVIYASTKEDDTLRYLSIHDNKYIRYFRGHKKRVTAVEMSPIDDTLMTSSLDHTVRLWDLRSSTCQGVLHGEGKTLVAFDPQGLVFAIATNNDTVRVYDCREYLNGPFAVWPIQDPQNYYPPVEWTSLKFTSDGKKIIITTVSDTIYVIDAFEGTLLQRFVGHAGPNSPSTCGEEVCITPDAKYLMAGGRDSYLRIWDLNADPHIMDQQPFVTLQTPHQHEIRMMGHNPMNAMCVTGSNELVSLLLLLC
ncbi:WD repeat-containing protein 82 [Choanephora cucurbitarum]|uniref:WD repeat-containing protein 82 n=1 Tax=Choanephora cucurbitarum TaxID=101091 RepID=A0A1C7MXB5_9FUNG|nr:WD repeat-containing protein 82 [Choanephora cucurbitarum]